MQTDSIFYQLFQTFPSIFFELISQPNVEVSRYEFKSVEIKQTAFRIDGVFFPSANLPNPLIYFVEVQFQQDINFYYRLFTEVFLFLGQNKPKKIGVPLLYFLSEVLIQKYQLSIKNYWKANKSSEFI